MNELGRMAEALEVIAAQLEQLRILKEHELGVHLEYDEHGPYIPSEADAKPAEEE